jgi:hypothetical protein
MTWGAIWSSACIWEGEVATCFTLIGELGVEVYDIDMVKEVIHISQPMWLWWQMYHQHMEPAKGLQVALLNAPSSKSSF